MLCQNFAYIISKKADYYPNDAAILEAHNGKKHTYLDIHQRSNRLANALADLGMVKGDRLLCLTRNTIEYIDIFLAVARLGAIVVPINYRLSNVEILRIVEDAAPKVVVFESMFRDRAEAIRDSHKEIKSFITYGGERPGWAADYDSLMGKYGTSGPAIAGDPEDPLLMLFTAGSTGRPKGVPLSHQNMFFRSVDSIVDLGFTRQDYTLTVIPLFHIGGHILWTLPHLHMGAKIMLYPQFEAEITLKLIQQEKITNIFLGPTMLKMIMRVPGWENYDLNSLRFMGAGGEPVLSSFARWKFPVFNAYGLTETADGTTFLRPELVTTKPPNCIGKTFTSVEAKVVDGEGKEVAPGVPGELLHRGPTVVKSYWQRPADSAKAFRDGWLHTGDLVTRDAEGFLYFLGRTDDMFISGGENIFPAEVEEIIYKYPKVADVAVIGVPDEVWGQVPKAIIVPKEGTTITQDEIIAHVKQHLASFKKPRIIEFVDDLPKLGTGKLARKQIKDMYGKPPAK